MKCISRRRSNRVVQDQGGMGESGCRWSDLPPELLREVLLKIEAAESCWPLRKSVVACAGVCRSWRQITKEIVKVPEISGKLTFPISVKQPGPRDCLVHCFIKRNRSTQTYYLYLSLTSALIDDGKFLLVARRCRRATCTDHVISLCVNDMSKGCNYIGKLRSNFLGTKFTIFDGQPSHDGAKMARSRSSKLVNLKQVSPRIPCGNYPVAQISYELNMLGTRGPRKMECFMDVIPATAIEPGGMAPPTQTEFSTSSTDFFPSIPFFRSKTIRTENIKSGPLNVKKDGPLVLRNKSPRWHEQLQCWCLNFHGRVTIASVKNFQLAASPENRPATPEHEKIILQFGKVGKDIFTMDYRYPISAFQAFAICLSSFDTKIACE